MPPKKNKKPSKNGYWQFVMECRDRNQKHMSMQELQTYASRKWANMTRDERQPYEEMAKLARETYNPVRYTTDGLEIDEVERKAKEATQKLQDMREDITRSLKHAAISETLDDQVFLIIHINHLIYFPAEDKYFICEVAVAAVSLKNGIEEVYHSIIKPGKLPLGFYGGALAHSKETHQLIELVQEEPFEDNTEEVAHDIERLIEKYGTSIVYADEKTFEMTTKVFENWVLDKYIKKEIKVYNFQYLFLALRNAAAGRTVWPNESFSYSALERDIWSHAPKISCDYHELTDISVYCSKSIVTRYAYTLCDYCCSDLGIQLVPGFHVPHNSKIVNESRISSKAPSVCTDDDFRHRNRADSLSSTSYDDNYPPLGGAHSSASSFVSFSSMKSKKQTSKAATRIEQSFKALEVGDAKRDHRNLKFPPHGCDNRRGE